MSEEKKSGGLLSGVASRLKTGRISRAFDMSKLAATTSSKWLVGKAKEAVSNNANMDKVFTEMAEQMLPTMANMRGMSMKLGQMLSYLDDFLPPEARKVLTVLQKDSVPMPWEQIQAQFVSSMGKEPEEIFATFEQEPIAAASIGQVHRATLHDGTPVAVKIQYPGIEDAMNADMKNVKFMGMFQQLMFMNVDLKQVFHEVQQRFLEECDYTIEARYQKLFAERFQEHPTIVVPKVFDEFSSSKVLTTEWMEGITFQQWLETNPTEEDRLSVTKTFYRFYIGSFYMDGLFNCDPHPGNYIFLDANRVAFLDYGCTRIFPEERRKLWIAMCQAVSSDNQEEMEKLAVQLHFLKEGSKHNKEAFRLLLRYLYNPYLEDAEFDFYKQRPNQTFREMFLDNPNLFKLNMPADAVFLNRIGFGLVSLLAEIGSKLNCLRHSSQYFENIDPDWSEDPFRETNFSSQILASGLLERQSPKG